MAKESRTDAEIYLQMVVKYARFSCGLSPCAEISEKWGIGVTA